ncbi:50S ribosomal protein L32 [candidate division KSB1 bacterium]
MRINRAATGRRRSGHGLEEPRTSTCSNCKAPHLRHRMCSECGHYRGRLVTDVAAKAEKKALKQESKRKEMGEDKEIKDERPEDGVKDEKEPVTPKDEKPALSPEGILRK